MLTQSGHATTRQSKILGVSFVFLEPIGPAAYFTPRQRSSFRVLGIVFRSEASNRDLK
jgi:hypothetical protein